MLYAFAGQLFWKLCWYIRRISNICTRKGWNSGCIHPLVNIHSYRIQLLFQPIVTLNSLVASNLSWWGWTGLLHLIVLKKHLDWSLYRQTNV